MADALTQAMPQASVAVARPALDRGFDPRTAIAFFGLLAIGVLFVAFNLFSDISASAAPIALLATMSCNYGIASARPRNERRCWPSPKVSPAWPASATR